MISPIRSALLGIMLGNAIPVQATDLGTRNGCAASDTEFKSTRLWEGPAIENDNLGNGAIKMAFDARDGGFADVYFIQKHGWVKRYNGRSGTVDSIGAIPVDHELVEGLTGIALDPAFKSNRWLYCYFSWIESAGNYTWRLSRFSLGPNGNIDLASERVLLGIPRVKTQAGDHTGGAMEFDAYGDLWIGVGDNTSTELGPGNTADLRGGILRIHPDERAAGGYTIPKGNFGERFAARLQTEGNADLARQYADTAKVKPEIYVKGTRNAYSVTLDPVRRWLAWGDVGPDQGRVSEEYNLVKEPFYMGWPYFAGEENMAGIAPYATPLPAGTTRANPVNNHGGSAGVRQLPTVREPIFAKPEACAISGSILRYDGSVRSSGRFPPQLDRKWLVSDCSDNRFGFNLLTLDSLGEKVVGNVAILKQIPINTLVDLKQGPDGSIYFINWRGGLNRIEYWGTCQDDALLPEKTGCATPGFANYDPATPQAFNDSRLCTGGTALARRRLPTEWIRLEGKSVSVDAPGAYTIRILDTRGRLMVTLSGTGKRYYTFPPFPTPGLYHISVETRQGAAYRTVSWLGD